MFVGRCHRSEAQGASSHALMVTSRSRSLASELPTTLLAVEHPLTGRPNRRHSRRTSEARSFRALLDRPPATRADCSSQSGAGTRAIVSPSQKATVRAVRFWCSGSDDQRGVGDQHGATPAAHEHSAQRARVERSVPLRQAVTDQLQRVTGPRILAQSGDKLGAPGAEVGLRYAVPRPSGHGGGAGDESIATGPTGFMCMTGPPLHALEGDVVIPHGGLRAGACSTRHRTTSGAREDDESPGRAGHRDVAVDRSFDALAERLWVDEDDQVELKPLRQLGGQ